jgi:hypothetical protein
MTPWKDEKKYESNELERSVDEAAATVWRAGKRGGAVA